MPLEPIPFFVPEIGQAEIDEVVAALQSGWLTTGPRVKQFEADFAALVGARHAVALNSATAALHLALEAIGVGPDDEVIVPTMTFAATAEVVLHLGARPVLVDCLPGSLNIDPEKVAAALTPRTKAVMPMHYGGQPCRMKELQALSATHGFKLIEDAAHALPAKYGQQMIGSIGDLTAFSFYANKTITTGEGGMLTTDNDEYAERARSMSLHGLSRDAWKRFAAGGSWRYEIQAPGYKYNMTDLAAGLGIQQLRRAQEFRDARASCAKSYTKLLQGFPELELPVCEPGVSHAWHLYVIRLRTEQLRIGRDEVIALLGEAGISTSVHWMPLHMHPYYRNTYGYRQNEFPVARAVFERIISLPIYPRLTLAQQQRIVSTLAEILYQHRR